MHKSSEGLIRLSLDELLSIPMRHLLSGMDEEVGNPVRACGRPTTISGFTEWVTHTEHPISLGWDWGLKVGGDTPRCVRMDMPRTNVLIVDAEGRDLPWAQSLERLATMVDSLPWSSVVTRAIFVS